MPRGVYERTEKHRIRSEKQLEQLKKLRTLNIGRKLSKETIQKMINYRLGRKRPEISGDKNYRWNKNRLSYRVLHYWVEKNLGKPKYCEHCKSKDKKRYDWANISREYKMELNDWIRLCRSCHIKFDKKEKINGTA